MGDSSADSTGHFFVLPPVRTPHLIRHEGCNPPPWLLPPRRKQVMPRPYRVSAPPAVPGQRTFYRLASLMIVVLALYWAQVILLPLALAILFAFALTPPA